MLTAKDLLASITRTFVPLIMGGVITWLATRHITLDDLAQFHLRTALEIFISGSYYVVIRLFEHYVSPKFGWLLGYAAAPNYVPASAQAATSVDSTDPNALK